MRSGAFDDVDEDDVRKTDSFAQCEAEPDLIATHMLQNFFS